MQPYRKGGDTDGVTTELRRFVNKAMAGLDGEIRDFWESARRESNKRIETEKKNMELFVNGLANKVAEAYTSGGGDGGKADVERQEGEAEV